MSEAELVAATGISRRNLIRWRQQGLIPVSTPRRGLGRGRGTAPLEYPRDAVPTINRLHELRKIKDVEERRWRLWLEGFSVRIAPDLANIFDKFQRWGRKIRTLEDIEKIPASIWKPANMPRGDPLRTVFRDIEEEDLRSIIDMGLCVCLGIRLPMFDEPNPRPWQIFKRALDLPAKWEFPPGLFDLFPAMFAQVYDALLTASRDELGAARTVCGVLSRLLEDPRHSRRGAIEIFGEPLPWRPIKFAALSWPFPPIRAVTVGLVIIGYRAFRKAFPEEPGSVPLIVPAPSQPSPEPLP